MKWNLKWKIFHGQVWRYYGTWVSYYAVLIFSPESLQWHPVILCPRHLSPLICSVLLAPDDWSDFKQAATAAMIGTELTTPSLNLIAVWGFSFFFFLFALIEGTVSQNNKSSTSKKWCLSATFYSYPHLTSTSAEHLSFVCTTLADETARVLLFE